MLRSFAMQILDTSMGLLVQDFKTVVPSLDLGRVGLAESQGVQYREVWETGMIQLHGTDKPDGLPLIESTFPPLSLSIIYLWHHAMVSPHPSPA